MIPIKKNLILTILVGAMILSVAPTSVFPRLIANSSGLAYDEGDGGSSIADGIYSISSPIETYVIKGAGYYLTAYSDLLVFLALVENSDLAGMDYDKSQQVLNRVLDNMNNALQTYYILIQRAERTPYNETFISKLMDYDYVGSLENWKLNSVIFKKAEEYLQRGDVTGCYKYIYNECLMITWMLYPVNNDLYLKRMPELSHLWKINERCSDVLLFGQYLSRVFYAAAAAKN